MAGPVAHIIVALSLLPCLSEITQKEYIIGTSFPDIRYLGIIEREQTHNPHASWQTIQKEHSSFKKGMDVHALLDIERERFFEEHGMYELIPEFPHRAFCMKIAEDRLIYEMLTQDQWQEIGDYFDNPDILEMAIEEKYIKKWYGILKKYCAQKPSLDMIAAFAHLLHHADVTELKNNIEQLENNEQFKKIVFEFYSNVKRIIGCN